ncbi:hypothetical protein NL676_029915 [Syzygium grande]|nr:hypothetical protein NL676_029915 [Syzygium grande]
MTSNGLKSSRWAGRYRRLGLTFGSRNGIGARCWELATVSCEVTDQEGSQISLPPPPAEPPRSHQIRCVHNLSCDAGFLPAESACAKPHASGWWPVVPIGLGPSGSRRGVSLGGPRLSADVAAGVRQNLFEIRGARSTAFLRPSGCDDRETRSVGKCGRGGTGPGV